MNWLEKWIKMLKKSMVLIMVLSIILFGCSKPRHQDITYIDDLVKTELPRPGVIIHNIDEFIYVLDYLAFYRVNEEVYFEIADTYKNNIENIYQEFQKAYRASDLADTYACVLDEKYYQDEDLVGIKYSITKDIAINKNKAEQVEVIKNYDYYLQDQKIFELPIETKKTISCETSEQLYYLAMKGYCPKPKKDSVAEKIYQDAKNILYKRIVEDDSSLLKIKKIYDYLTSEIYYDHQTAISNSDNLIAEQAYYLEGVFLNNNAVCDGKAKAYALLLNMLGIPCLRITGNADLSDHAWNMVEFNNEWYLSCSTFGRGKKITAINAISPNYSMMLVGKDDFEKYGWEYVADKYIEVEKIMAKKSPDVYKGFNELLSVNNINDVKNMYEKLKSKLKNKYKLEFRYNGKNATLFEEELTKYLNDKNIKIMKIKGDTIYQLIYLK